VRLGIFIGISDGLTRATFVPFTPLTGALEWGDDVIMWGDDEIIWGTL
jgi:hypothetical protein